MRSITIIFFLFSCLIFQFGKAQLPAIGNWREHLPYAQAIQVLNGNEKIWCATNLSLFSIDKNENSIDRLTKVNGLTETGINCIGWDNTSNSLLIAYSNSNLDIITTSGIKNINSIKNSPLSGDKTIFEIFIRNELAYLSTALGIVVIDLMRAEVKDSYIIGNNGNRIKVFSVSVDNSSLYAATEEGLKKAPIAGSNLSDYRNWQNISGGNGLSLGPVLQVGSVGNNVVARKQDSLFIQNAGTWNFLYHSGWRIENISVSENKLLICETQNSIGRVVSLTTSGAVLQIIQDLNFTSQPSHAIELNNEYWIADRKTGLSKFTNNNFQSYLPNSPGSAPLGDLYATGNSIWAAAGSVTSAWQPEFNKKGVHRLQNNSWINYPAPVFDSLPDIISLAADPRDNSLWGGSFGGGLFSINENGIFTVFKQNSPIQAATGFPGSYRVSGLAFDATGNLWLSNYGATQNLHVRKTDGSWRSFSVPFPIAENAVASITIDDFDQKWILLPNGQGLICFNHGASIDNPGDDRWKWYRSGTSNGNLPDNHVLCLAKDKNGFIWIGTRRGIGIVQCPQEVFSPQGCEAILPIVQQDNFAGYLFRDEEVQCIAVDGADRKWIGTKNGAWLISSDGDKTIYRFNSANSPLPDDDVRRIAIDPKTGETFFATAKGLVSFRSTAIEGITTTSDLLVFPNPVPPGYTGTIAIRGVINNSIVKITELNGRLVYQTRSLGGQAIWNGKNYRGQTVSSGTYLVFISDDTKKEKMATKIVFLKK
jgi:ligand-binding sensor domain-containing protein